MAGWAYDSAPTHTGASLSYPASSSRFSSWVSPISATSAPASRSSLSSALLASANEPAAEPAPSSGKMKNPHAKSSDMKRPPTAPKTAKLGSDISSNLRRPSAIPRANEKMAPPITPITAKPRATSTTVGPKNGQRIAPKPNHAAAQVNPYRLRHGCALATFSWAFGSSPTPRAHRHPVASQRRRVCATDVRAHENYHVARSEPCVVQQRLDVAEIRQVMHVEFREAREPA